MARQKKSINDKYWPEVEKINSYAIFMGYLLMGVRGLGLLVLTWTTVVLLGGFVSMLPKKDFWCLTAITLVQIAGAFDFLLKEMASDVGNSLKGLLFAVLSAVGCSFRMHTMTFMNLSTIMKGDKRPYKVLAVVLLVVQVLVLGIVLCPLAVLYVLGLYLSAGISLWRLIQHDYGNPDGGTNLKPALNILYSLALAQGMVYGYKIIYDSAARTGLVKDVAKDYSLETDLISEYLEETVEGCMKDRLFARGRNLVTYAVDLLMESKSSHSYISGVLILGRVITHHDMHLKVFTRSLKKRKVFTRAQTGLIKQLLTRSASFSHVVQQLVETFGPRSPYSTEIRVRAARIVGIVAGSVRLEQFPKGTMIECISSLLEEYSWQPEGHRDQEYERDWLLDYEEVQWYRYSVDDTIPTPMAADNGHLFQSYEDLVVQGLRILRKLAINEDNCRVIANAQGLLSKTMAHLISDKLHRDHHNEWYRIATESLEFMRRLMATLSLGGTDITKLRSELSSNIQATTFRILECHKCGVLLKRQAAQVLLQLCPDTLPSNVSDESGGTSIIFPWILLDIFLLPQFDRMRGSAHLAKKSSDIARLAGEKIQATISSKTGQSDITMLPSVIGDLIGSLARTVAGEENNAYRIHAATILKNLCEDYSKNDENLKELKKAMTSAMPEMLKEIVHWLTTEEIQVVTEANNGGSVLLAEVGLDLEQGGVSHDTNGQESSSTSHQQKGEQHQGIQLQQALLDLCWAINWSVHKDQDLTRQFNEITVGICSRQGMPYKTFREFLGEAQNKLREEKRVHQLIAIETET